VNSINNDTRIGISQTFSFPAVYSNQRKILEANLLVSRAQTRMTEQEIRAGVRQLFYEYAALTERKKLLMFADSIYTLFETKSNLRFEKGEANVLEKTAAQTHRQQITNQLNLLNKDLSIAVKQFNMFVQDTVQYMPASSRSKIENVAATSASTDQLPVVELAKSQQKADWFRWKTEKSKQLPDITVGYNNQSLIGSQLVNGNELYYHGKNRFSYVSAGVSVPLFFKAQSARAAAARIDWERSRKQADYIQLVSQTNLQTAADQAQKYLESLEYYESQALQNADLIITTADAQFQAGDINYLQWVILVDQAITIKSEHIQALASYNTAVIELLKLNNL
jgi:cobalt-zinc-cadmium resistance protein CzcA